MEAPSDTVYGALYPMLANAGVRPVSDEMSASAWRLKISVQDLTVSAYDFLVTRKVSADVTMQARLLSPDGTAQWGQQYRGKSSQLRRYGFEPQLQEALNAALSQALLPLVERLRSSLKATR